MSSYSFTCILYVSCICVSSYSCAWYTPGSYQFRYIMRNTQNSLCKIRYTWYKIPATLAPGARRVPTSAGQAIARAAFVLQVIFFLNVFAICSFENIFAVSLCVLEYFFCLFVCLGILAFSLFENDFAVCSAGENVLLFVCLFENACLRMLVLLFVWEWFCTMCAQFWNGTGKFEENKQS